MSEQWKPDFTPISTVDTKTAELVKEAYSLFHNDEDTAEYDCLSDCLSELYGHVFPGTQRMLTAAESAEYSAKLNAEESAKPRESWRDELAASKALAYLQHVSSIIECYTQNLEQGPYAGEFVLCREHRTLISWMMADAKAELLKIEAFQKAAGLEGKL